MNTMCRLSIGRINKDTSVMFVLCHPDKQTARPERVNAVHGIYCVALHYEARAWKAWAGRDRLSAFHQPRAVNDRTL